MEDHNLQEAARCAAYFKALADPVRLQAVRALQAGPLTVTDVAIQLDLELAKMSHHLRVLYNAGLVKTERDGKYIYYSLTDKFTRSEGRALRGALDFGCCRLDLRMASTN